MFLRVEALPVCLGHTGKGWRTGICEECVKGRENHFDVGDRAGTVSAMDSIHPFSGWVPEISLPFIIQLCGNLLYDRHMPPRWMPGEHNQHK